MSSLLFGSISRAHTSDFECLIADLIEPQRLVRPGQVGPQDLAGVRAHHRIPARADLRLRLQLETRLISVDPAPGHRRQRREIALGMGEPDVLD